MIPQLSFNALSGFAEADVILPMTRQNNSAVDDFMISISN